MEKLFHCAMDIGEQMLLSGAEVHRVEDSMERMCTALGMQRVDSFIITSSMVVSVRLPDGKVLTQTRRIKSSGMDFHRLDLLNKLSRRICASPLTAEEMQKELALIMKEKRYPFWAEVLLYAVIAAVFTVFFGGGGMQIPVSFFIGGVLRFVVLLAERTVKNTMFSKFISSVFVTAVAVLMTRLGVIDRMDEVMIGNIMLLISGLGFTNAIKDLFTGDSIAGILRLLEAVLNALAIASGYVLFVLLVGGVS